MIFSVELLVDHRIVADGRVALPALPRTQVTIGPLFPDEDFFAAATCVEVRLTPEEHE